MADQIPEVERLGAENAYYRARLTETEAERDALRAEVATLRTALSGRTVSCGACEGVQAELARYRAALDDTVDNAVAVARVVYNQHFSHETKPDAWAFDTEHSFYGDMRRKTLDYVIDTMRALRSRIATHTGTGTGGSDDTR